MKKILFIILALLVGVVLGSIFGYRFTQDLSMQAVEDVLDEAYSGVQVAYQDSEAQAMVQDFNEKLKENIAAKKAELEEQVRLSINAYLKKKIDEIF